MNTEPTERDVTAADSTPARPAFTLLVTGPGGEELACIEGTEIKERIDGSSRLPD